MTNTRADVTWALAKVFEEFLETHPEVCITAPAQIVEGKQVLATIRYGRRLRVRVEYELIQDEVRPQDHITEGPMKKGGQNAPPATPRPAPPVGQGGSSPAGDAVNANAGMRTKRKPVRKQ